MTKPTNPSNSNQGITPQHLQDIGTPLDSNGDVELRLKVLKAVGHIKVAYEYGGFAPTMQSQASVTTEIMQLIQSERTRAAAEAVKPLRYKMSKHFTSWGGEQGNCVPEDVLDEQIRHLALSNPEQPKEEAHE